MVPLLGRAVVLVQEGVVHSLAFLMGVDAPLAFTTVADRYADSSRPRLATEVALERSRFINGISR